MIVMVMVMESYVSFLIMIQILCTCLTDWNIFIILSSMEVIYKTELETIILKVGINGI